MLLQWEHVKQLLKLIVAAEFEYYAEGNEMVIFSARGERRREKFNFTSIASLRYALDNNIALENVDTEKFFKAKFFDGSYQFCVRKGNPSDLATLKDVCTGNEYAFLYPYLPGKSVVDVGANIGDTAVLFAKRGAALIEAYEIHPVLHDVARRNIELNGVNDKVRLYDFGIGSTADEMRMRDDSSLGPTAGFGLKEAQHGRDVVVKLVSMKSVIERLREIDILKMDCAGAEFDIFQSLSHDDLRSIGVIGVEYHRDPQPLISRLEQSGFDVKMISSHSSSLGLLLAVRV